MLLLALAITLAYACRKESRNVKDENFLAYKNYIHENGGIYSDETIAVKAAGGVVNGRLDWNNVTKIFYEGKQYIFIHFRFAGKSGETSTIAGDAAQQIPEASFSLVLKYKGAGVYDIALNTRLISSVLSGNASTQQGTLEDYYTTDGEWMNSWWYNLGSDSAEKIFKKLYSNSSALNAATNTSSGNYMAEPDCQTYSATTYQTQ